MQQAGGADAKILWKSTELLYLLYSTQQNAKRKKNTVFDSKCPHMQTHTCRVCLLKSSSLQWSPVNCKDQKKDKGIREKSSKLLP